MSALQPERRQDMAAWIKRLRSLDSSKGTCEKFRDFLELAYCAFAKLTADPERAEDLEARYMRVVGSYRNKEDVRAYPELLGAAYLAVQSGGDFLGVIACELGALDSRAGQFFTPYHVSRMMAEMLLADAGGLIEAQGFITVGEPAAGAGGMVLAAADALEKQGHDPGRHMLVNAADLSPLCFQMCFLQLAWRGIPALVERMNSLSQERFEAAWTPATGAFYAEHGRLFPEGRAPATETPAPPLGRVQLDLFGEAGA